jgi:hypothetical protein
MSFLRHREIFPSDEDAGIASVLAHRLDEFPVDYSLAGCAPALPASASPTASEYALTSFYRSMIFHQPVHCVLTVPEGSRPRNPMKMTQAIHNESGAARSGQTWISRSRLTV